MESQLETTNLGLMSMFMWFEIGKKYLYYSLWSVHDGANVNNMTQLIIEALIIGVH
jgi:hypothetical protein